VSAAAVLPINSEHFDFHGYDLSASRDLRCLFCPPRHEVRDASWPPGIAFLSQSRDEALQVHAQLTICAEHLRELADKAEHLTPERWSPERDDLTRRTSAANQKMDAEATESEGGTP
jgi:hypothetical protein